MLLPSASLLKEDKLLSSLRPHDSIRGVNRALRKDSGAMKNDNICIINIVFTLCQSSADN